jgi:hypothetical protein
MLLSNTYPSIDFRKQIRHEVLMAPIARQPLLPDRDTITTNAWSEAYNHSLGSSLGDEEEERILWPRGVCVYSLPFIGSLAIPDRALPLIGSYSYGGLDRRCISTQFLQAEMI